MIEKDETQVEPQSVAATNAQGPTKEDLEVVNMVKDQLAGVLKAADCILVPVTTIINGKIFQTAEVMRRPKPPAIQPVKGNIIKP